MSQLFDYFVCSAAAIDRWIEALANQDEETQQTIEDEMQTVITIKGFDQDALVALAQCSADVSPGALSPSKDIRLVRAISDEEGPWVMAYSSRMINVVARMEMTASLVARWNRMVAKATGQAEDKEIVTMEAAEAMQTLCQDAEDGKLGLFVCFYG